MSLIGQVNNIYLYLLTITITMSALNYCPRLMKQGQLFLVNKIPFMLINIEKSALQ